jgi:tetratricopeptide (TPR) repeat protein
MRSFTIEDFPPHPAADVSGLQAQPSRLLDARSQVVGFVGRVKELDHLCEWRDRRDSGLSVLLLHGPGGQGKTRLAAEFAERSRSENLAAARRWRVWQAGMDGGTTSAGMADHAGVAEDEAGILLIVDYADRWAHSELMRLFADPLLHRQRPVRVLLIGRTVRWFAPVRAALLESRVAAENLLLSPLAEDRMSMFAAARDRLIQPDLYDLPGATNLEPPGSLEHPDFGLPLTLHMAALAVVDAHAHGRRAPGRPHELSAYLLDREYLAWQRLFEAGREGQDYRTRLGLMARVVFTATLTGAVSHDDGVAALRMLDLPDHPEHLLLDHLLCYPAKDQRKVLEPLYPDRLAEDFLALLTPGHDITDYAPDPWTIRVPSILLSNEHGLRPVIAPRAVYVLASAADRWPHLREQTLQPLLAADPNLALDGGSIVLTTLADMNDIAPTVLDKVNAAFDALVGGERHVDLDVGIASVAERVILHEANTMDLRTAEDVGRASFLWHRLSERMANAGEREKALVAAEACVRYCRFLAADFPGATHQSLLVESLVAVSTRLSALDRHEEALAAGEEALNLVRQLAEADPDAHQHGLAVTLGNVGTFLSRLGRYEEALACAQETRALTRRLADSDPHGDDADLARSLDNLAATLSENKQYEEALPAAEDAVRLWRQLVGTAPETHLPDLASTLYNLSDLLAKNRRDPEAIATAEESVVLRRRLADANPAAHLPDLGRSLRRLNRLASHQVGGQDAWAIAEEMVHVYRQLADTALDGDSHLLDLANSLCKLATLEVNPGRLEQRAAAAVEAVDLLRRLVDADPGAHMDDFLESLRTLRHVQAELGQHGRALPSVEAVVTNRRRFTQAGPDDFNPHFYLAHSLERLRNELSVAGRHERSRLEEWAAALAAAGLAISSHYTLARREPVHRSEFQAAMEGLRSLLSDLAARPDALDLIQRVRSACEDLIIRYPDIDGPVSTPPASARFRWLRRKSKRKLSTSRRRGAGGRGPRALDPDGHAPAAYYPFLANVLRTHAQIHAAQGINMQSTLTDIMMAMRILGALDERLPDAFTPDIALGKRTFAYVLGALARSEDTEAGPHVTFEDFLDGEGDRRQEPSDRGGRDAEFGCAACYGEDAEAAWQHFLREREYDRDLADDGVDHFSVDLSHCPTCSQSFVKVFAEFTWDAQYFVILPVTSAEVASLIDGRLDVYEVGRLGEGRRHLHSDNPTGAEEHAYWDTGQFRVVEP